MVDRELVVLAIAASTGFSKQWIRQTLEAADQGTKPLRLPGSMTWDIWICYRAIEEYERKRNE